MLTGPITMKYMSRDKFAAMYLTVAAGTKFPENTLRNINTGLELHIGNLMADNSFQSDALSSAESQYIHEVTVMILVNQLDGFRDCIATNETLLGAKSCTRTGGYLRGYLEGYGTVFCQYEVSKDYQTDGTPPAWRNFELKTGKSPDFSDWSRGEIVETPQFSFSFKHRMHPDSANALWQNTYARQREQHRPQTGRVKFNLGDSEAAECSSPDTNSALGGSAAEFMIALGGSAAEFMSVTEVMDGLWEGLGDSTTRLADEFAESADKFVDAFAATFGSTRLWEW